MLGCRPECGVQTGGFWQHAEDCRYEDNPFRGLPITEFIKACRRWACCGVPADTACLEGQDTCNALRQAAKRLEEGLQAYTNAKPGSGGSS